MRGFISFDKAVGMIQEGMTVMAGGFLNCGAPLMLLEKLAKDGPGNLTIISNDAGHPGIGVGALFSAGKVKALTTSHIGLNPDAGIAMNDKIVDITLVPQGSFVERIRAGGAGLGGILTPTGVGTLVEEGKQKITVDGREYLLELPIKADVALIAGYQADRAGNVFYRGSARNMNPIMATAADIVILEVESIVDEINPEHVHTPGIFVDYIVERGGCA